MDIIPVIDLMHGLVVHAREGRREQYQPLVSPLCASPEPSAVVAGLLALHPFRTIYIADLDALMGRARQTQIIHQLRRDFPDLVFWLDQGLTGSEDCQLVGIDPALAVIGSESLNEASLGWLAEAPAPFILSLDSLDGRALGPESLAQRPELWPETVILMTLSRVGSQQGPDFALAASYLRQHPQRRWIAAGGVRHTDDLEQLKAMGIAGVLMASALHSGAVDAAMLAQLSR